MEDQTVDKDKFDAVLNRLIQTPPMTVKDAVKVPKLKSDGTPKKKRFVRKVDK